MKKGPKILRKIGQGRIEKRDKKVINQNKVTGWSSNIGLDDHDYVITIIIIKAYVWVSYMNFVLPF